MLDVKFEGIEVSLNDTIYVLPTLSVLQLKNMIAREKDDIVINENTKEEDKFEEFVKLANYIAMAFHRNYKDISVEDFTDLVLDEYDLNNLNDIVDLFMWITHAILPKDKKKATKR